jgi:hypothetical protein
MAGHRTASHAELSPETEPSTNCRRELWPVYTVGANIQRALWKCITFAERILFNMSAF